MAERGIIIEFDFAVANGAETLFGTAKEFLAKLDGIPFGVACFRIAGFSFCPFGKKLVPTGDAGLGTAIFNIIWIVFAGFWLALGSAVLGVAYCLTIIGIPWGIACFNIAQASFAPLGKRVVSS